MFNKKNPLIDVPCPNCGTIHQVPKIHAKERYLDGIPKLNIDDIVNEYCICAKCGYIYNFDAQFTPHEQYVIQSKKYIDVLTDTNMDETCKKIKLLELSTLPYQHLELWWVHYYHAKNDREQELNALNAAINRLVNLKDSIWNLSYSFDAKCLPDLKLKRNFILHHDEILVDLYRRAGQFDAAQSQIKYIREKYTHINYNTDIYLSHQEFLIKQKDSALY